MSGTVLFRRWSRPWGESRERKTLPPLSAQECLPFSESPVCRIGRFHPLNWNFLQPQPHMELFCLDFPVKGPAQQGRLLCGDGEPVVFSCPNGVRPAEGLLGR